MQINWVRKKYLCTCNISAAFNYVPFFFIAGWLYRKKFIKVKNASMTIQRWARGYLARRKVIYIYFLISKIQYWKKKLLKIFISKFQVFHIRRHHAAITMQRYIRGWVKRSQYLQAKDRTLRLQVCLQGVPD